MAANIKNNPGQAGLDEAHDALASPTDALAQHYTAVASDGKKADREREAAVLFSVAESKLDDGALGNFFGEDCFEECETSARQALALFKEEGNKDGCADALRLIVHALRSKAEALRYKAGEDDKSFKEILQQAEAIAEDELTTFKSAGFKRGQAAMLLSWAEVNEDKRGSKKREEALERATEAKALAQDVGDDKLQAHAALCIATIKQKRGDRGEAVNMADESASLYRKVGDKKGEAKALHMLGITRVQADQFEDGVQAAVQALALYKEIGNAKEEAFVNYVISQYYIGRNLPQIALSHAQEALKIFKTLGKRPGKGLRTPVDLRSWLAQAHGAVVGCLIASGKPKEALRQAEALRQDSELQGDRWQDRRAEAFGFATLSRAHVALDDYKAALQASEDALNSAQAMKDARWEAHMMRQVAQVHILMKNYNEATKIGQESAGLMQGIQDKQEEAILLNTVGESACEQYDYDTVFETAQEQRALFQQTGDRSREASCLLAAASCIYDSRFDEAMDMVQEAMDIFEDLKEERGIARCYRNRAIMYKGQGDYECALRSASNMREKMAIVGDKAAEANAALLEAEIQLLRDNPTVAVKLANEAQSLCKRSGDKTAEISAWIMVSSAIIENLMQKGQTAMEKGRAKALKPAQEALSMAKKLNCKLLIANALYQVGTVHMLTARIGDAMQAANEARTIYHSKGEVINETAVVMLMAETQFAAGKEDRAVQLAEEVVAMTQATGDATMRDRAQKLIDKIHPPQPMGPPGGWVMTQQPGPGAAEASELVGEAAVASAVVVAPVVKGLDPAMVSKVVLDVAKNIIGSSDEEMTEDGALMDMGLDSLSALSFRQTLSQQVSMKLPSSLVFDYPSVREVTARIVEISLED